jgi:hypothetical protein
MLNPAIVRPGQKVAMFYDPSGHAVRTLSTDGSEQRVIFGVPGTITSPDLVHPEIFEPTPLGFFMNDGKRKITDEGFLVLPAFPYLFLICHPSAVEMFPLAVRKIL